MRKQDLKDEIMKRALNGAMMFTLQLVILLLLATVIMCSCRSPRYIPVETKITETIETFDTVYEVKLVPYRDSVVVDDTISYLSNEYGGSWARWSKGKLHHSLFVFPGKIITIEIPKTILIKRREVVPQIGEIEKKLNKWQQIKIDYGGYAILALLFIIVWLIYKKRNK